MINFVESRDITIYGVIAWTIETVGTPEIEKITIVTMTRTGTLAESERFVFEDKHEGNNIMEFDESIYDSAMPPIISRFNLESDYKGSENEKSGDKHIVEYVYLLRNKLSKNHQPINKRA